MKSRYFYKAVGYLLLLPLLSTLLIGCGGENSQSSADEDKEITVLYVFDQFWKDQAEEFTEVTGINVKYETVPFTQVHDKLLTAFSGGSDAYDIIPVRDDWVAEFGSKGFLEPLDSFVTDELKSEFTPKNLEAISYEGKLYGVPRYVWLWQFYYNKALFKEAGIEEPPKTWDELAEMAKKLTKDGVYGYAEPWGMNFSYTPFIIHITAEGGEFWDYENNKPAFNSPEGIKALQFMVDMNLKYKAISPLSKEFSGTGPMSEVFTQGTIAMNMNTPHTYPMSNDPEKSSIVGDVGVALIPGSKLKTSSYAETAGVGIPASSKKKEWAWEYIKFVTSKEQQKKMALEVGRVPTNLEALNDPEVQEKYPHFKSVPEQLEYPFEMFKHENATEIGDAVSRNIDLALSGEISVEEALKQAEKEVLEIIDES